MSQTRRYITDVDEACALREAGLLWRDLNDSAYFIDEDYWEPDGIRKVGNLANAPNKAGFFILVVDGVLRRGPTNSSTSRYRAPRSGKAADLRVQVLYLVGGIARVQSDREH